MLVIGALLCVLHEGEFIIVVSTQGYPYSLTIKGRYFVVSKLETFVEASKVVYQPLKVIRHSLMHYYYY